MKRKLITLASCGLCALLTACSTPLTHTFIDVRTEPPGALLFNSENQYLGQEPMRIFWSEAGITKNANGLWEVSPITAKWPSGAKTTERFTYGGEKFRGLYGTIYRNMDAPKLDVDMTHANQVRQLRAQQEMIQKLSDLNRKP